MNVVGAWTRRLHGCQVNVGDDVTFDVTITDWRHRVCGGGQQSVDGGNGRRSRMRSTTGCYFRRNQRRM